MDNNTAITLNKSLELKGIAILLLLLHHLFYVQSGLYKDINIFGIPVIQQIAIGCKSCVAIFVFISGYGLSVKYNRTQINIKDFYKRRFIKLYLNYWLIWIVFVPVGIFYFGRTMDVIYHEHVFEKFFIMGILFSRKNIITRFFQNVNLPNILYTLFIFIILFIRGYLNFISYLTDLVIIFFLIKIINNIDLKYFTNSIAFLGKESMNIFLFHTFIYFFYFKDVIYMTDNPFIIYTSLLLICILISKVINKIKVYLHFNKLVEFLFIKL